MRVNKDHSLYINIATILVVFIIAIIAIDHNSKVVSQNNEITGMVTSRDVAYSDDAIQLLQQIRIKQLEYNSLKLEITKIEDEVNILRKDVSFVEDELIKLQLLIGSSISPNDLYVQIRTKQAEYDSLKLSLAEKEKELVSLKQQLNIKETEIMKLLREYDLLVNQQILPGEPVKPVEPPQNTTQPLPVENEDSLLLIWTEKNVLSGGYTKVFVRGEYPEGGIIEINLPFSLDYASQFVPKIPGTTINAQGKKLIISVPAFTGIKDIAEFRVAFTADFSDSLFEVYQPISSNGQNAKRTLHAIAFEDSSLELLTFVYATSQNVVVTPEEYSQITTSYNSGFGGRQIVNTRMNPPLVINNEDSFQPNDMISVYTSQSPALVHESWDQISNRINSGLGRRITYRTFDYREVEFYVTWKQPNNFEQGVDKWYNLDYDFELPAEYGNPLNIRPIRLLKVGNPSETHIEAFPELFNIESVESLTMDVPQHYPLLKDVLSGRNNIYPLMYTYSRRGRTPNFVDFANADLSTNVGGTKTIFGNWVSKAPYTSLPPNSDAFPPRIQVTIVDELENLPVIIPEPLNMTVEITGPSNNVEFNHGESINFESQIFNPLFTHTCTWHSSINGLLGNECELNNIDGLSVGTHTITLTVDDLAGGIKTDSRIINVLDAQSEPAVFYYNTTFVTGGEGGVVGEFLKFSIRLKGGAYAMMHNSKPSDWYISIDFGDGTIVTYDHTQPTNHMLGMINHYYSEPGYYTITISGDIDFLQSFEVGTATRIEQDISEFSKFKRLRALYLPSTRVYGDICDISTLTDMRRMKFTFSRGIGGDIGCLSGMTELVEVQMSLTDVHGDITVINNMPSLKKFSIRNYNNSELSGNVGNLVSNPNLEVLDVTGGLSGNIGQMPMFTNLIQLVIRNNGESESLTGDVGNIKNYPNLKKLELGGNQLLTGDVAGLKNKDFMYYLVNFGLGATNIYGDLCDLYSSLSGNAQYIVLTDMVGTSFTYTSPCPLATNWGNPENYQLWTGSPRNGLYLMFPEGLSGTDVDNFFIDINAVSTTRSPLLGNILHHPNYGVKPTTASCTARNELFAKGWGYFPYMFTGKNSINWDCN